MINEDNYRHFLSYNYKPVSSGLALGFYFICLLFTVPLYFLIPDRMAAIVTCGVLVFILTIFMIIVSCKMNNRRTSFLALGGYGFYLFLMVFALTNLFVMPSAFPSSRTLIGKLLFPFYFLVINVLYAIVYYHWIRRRIIKDKYNKKVSPLMEGMVYICAPLGMILGRLIGYTINDQNTIWVILAVLCILLTIMFLTSGALLNFMKYRYSKKIDF